MIPCVGACILLLVFAFHLTAAGQAITAAAAAAARAASLQPTSSAALSAAQAAATANLTNGTGLGQKGSCSNVLVTLDAHQFRPGGTAAVSVTCTLSTATLTGIGVPGHLTRTVTSRAPIDLYSASITGKAASS